MEPKWPVAEVSQRHQNRIAEQLKAAGVAIKDDDWHTAELDPIVSGERGEYSRLNAEFIAANWHNLPQVAREVIDTELAGDHRERIGWDRNDGKVKVRRTRRATFEALADEYGVPTNETAGGPWRDMVIAAVNDTPVKGRIA